MGRSGPSRTPCRRAWGLSQATPFSIIHAERLRLRQDARTAVDNARVFRARGQLSQNRIGFIERARHYDILRFSHPLRRVDIGALILKDEAAIGSVCHLLRMARQDGRSKGRQAGWIQTDPLPPAGLLPLVCHVAFITTIVPELTLHRVYASSLSHAWVNAFCSEREWQFGCVARFGRA